MIGPLAMMVLACAPHVSWDVQPIARVEVSAVAIAASSRECRAVADALTRHLSARPGLVIDPGAPTRLVVESCEQQIGVTVEVDDSLTQDDHLPGSDLRRTVVEGRGSTRVVVWQSSQEVAVLEGTGRRVEASAWTRDSTPPPRPYPVREAVTELVALDVADQVAPLPETLRRRLYRDPEPGTARDLHNQAVAAERQGELATAMELAREAYAAQPTAEALAYLEALEHHAARIGYAELATE